MRVLLIDNHDSYTYNVHRLLHQVLGGPPEVRRNDDPALDGRFLAGFDGVVLSPGPGRPGRAGDVGAVPQLLAASPLPVLGVCLGHQVLGHLAGARVVPAPRPRHGHLTRVHHRGRGLFAGLPQGFGAVRYHSLGLAEPLPAPLRAEAWSEDGVLMALSHDRRPWWGVQFHPESVASEHGLALVGAWRDLCAGAPQALVPLPSAPAAPRPTPQAPVPDRPARWVVRARRVRAEVSAPELHERLYSRRSHSFWLDSGRRGAGTGRFSVMGAPDGPHGEVLRARVGDAHVTVLDDDGAPRGRLRGDAVDALERRLAARSTRADPTLPFALQGGYVGCFSYEAKALTGFGAHEPAAHEPGTTPADGSVGTPDAVWVSATRYLVLDHDEGAVWIVSWAPAGCADPGAQRWADAVEEVLASCTVTAAPATTPEVPAPGAADLEEHLLTSREGYLAQVVECLGLLRRGESYEVCLTTQARVPAAVEPRAQYLRQRAANPAPYAAFLALGDVAVLCSSPERFLTVGTDGLVETRPIKGTAPRGADPAGDRALRDGLAASGKARAENLMIVDLLRHDLGRVCVPASVTVPALARVETYATVHQLVSTVRGALLPGTGATGAFRACFPPGSMTGAPKERTVRILDRLEGRPRGLYSGALGFFSATGAADLAVVIRTAVVAGGVVAVGAGGAVVLASDPVEEHEEMLLKVRGPLEAALAR